MTYHPTGGGADAPSASSHRVAYVPFHHEVILDLSAIDADAIRERWFHSRSGTILDAGERKKNCKASVSPPTDITVEDWICVFGSSEIVYADLEAE
jgi:hypothetical protein